MPIGMEVNFLNQLLYLSVFQDWFLLSEGAHIVKNKLSWFQCF